MGNISILKASAGSGKTYQLAYRYIRNIISDPDLYRRTLAVTFTNKATEEMKSRILSELNKLASGAGSPYLADLERDLAMPGDKIRERAAEGRTKILHDYGRFHVLTIDKFFQRIIRSFIKELGLDMSYTLELQTDSILESAADRLIESIRGDHKLREWIMLFVEDKISQNQKWDIRSELIELGAEIFREHFIFGNAPELSRNDIGRIVGREVARIGKIKEDMQKLAAEALAVISGASLDPADFAYGRNGVVSYFTKTAEGNIESYGKRVTDALGSDEKWYARTSPRRNEIAAIVPRLRELLIELCGAYDKNIVDINTAALVQENFRAYALLKELALKAREVCAEMNIVPISETNNIIHKLIDGNDVPFIYEKTGGMLTHYMIDEFQDTSRRQWENFVPLLDNALSQSAASPVLLVGDVKQSIYRWRGGDWQVLGKMVSERFDGTSIYDLDTNYRSAGTVVDFNNNLISRIVSLADRNISELTEEFRGKKYVDSRKLEHFDGILSGVYSGHSQNVSRSPGEGYVRITEIAKDTAEAEKPLLIETIESLQRRGYAPGDIAVLVRYNRQGRETARELLDYKAANPDSPYCYDLVTQEALMLGSSNVVNFIMSVMYLAVSPDNSIQRAVFNRFLDREPDDKFTDDERSLFASLRLISIEEAFEKILSSYSLNERTNDIAYIQALHNHIHGFSAAKIADMPIVLKWWEESGRSLSVNIPSNRNAISILTIHKAKGLQYKAVIIPDCSWQLNPRPRSLFWASAGAGAMQELGKVPLRWKNMIADSHFAGDYLEETVMSHIDNINTFYVAATRAEEELHIFIPAGQKPAVNIAGLISGAIEGGISGDSSGNDTRIGALAGRTASAGDNIIYEFGAPYIKEKQAHTKQNEPAVYYSSRRVNQIKFSTDSSRYFEEGDYEAILSPRNYGILMHRVFERINSAEDIETELGKMYSSAEISYEDMMTVAGMIRDSFEDPTIRSWFNPSWETVRNESGIIVPHGHGIKRPDRVIIKGNRAIVIDYKFGAVRKEYYKKQVRQYMDLLARMGYGHVTGYLWYISLREVVNADE